MATENEISTNTLEWGETVNTNNVQRVNQTESATDQQQTAADSIASTDGIFSDPLGDTFGFGTTQLDIESLSSSADGDAVTLKFDFFTPIAPPSSFSAESIVGYIDLDLDQNASTGTSSFQSSFAPPGQQGGLLGNEAYIDLFNESGGLVNLIDTENFTTIAQLPINYGSDFFEVQLAFDLLEEVDGINYGSVIGTRSEPTDAAPNTEFANLIIPPAPDIIGTEGDDVLTGTNRRELIDGKGGNDILQGLSGNDRIFGGGDNDLISAGDGNDIVEAQSGQDFISGGNGNDTLFGNQGQDNIFGGDDDDELYGGEDSDRLLGEAGNDTIDGNSGNDTVDGGTGNDTIRGGNGIDNLFGGSGSDSLSGEVDNDTLTGGFGNDNLDGGEGDDKLIGVDSTTAGSGVGFGAGEVDTLTGAPGSDTFVLADTTRVYYSDGDPLTIGDSDYALITDFNVSEDTIQLQGSADLYSLDFFTSTTGTIDALLIYDPGVTARGEAIAILQNASTDLTISSEGFSFV
jgi:Ca2+-binding RTX toxin-like protein